MTQGIARFIVLSLALFSAGCVTAPVQNRQLVDPPSQNGYRYSNIAPGKDNSDSLFVVLAFSGGGTRAAALSYGVLEKLRDTQIVWQGKPRRLLDEVDVISSVSGGSLTAAYYTLFGDRIFTDFPDKVLYRNLQSILVKRILAIGNVFKLFSPLYGRSDIMAETFTSSIFEKKTYGDLIKENERPFLVVNSTDVTLGKRFAFTQEQFDLLDSDLASYPVGHAVAASAAYPGLLSPMTLRNYPKDESYTAPDWVTRSVDPRENRFRASLVQGYQSYLQPGKPYVHLVDGGVSDNLGILPIIEFMTGAVPRENIQRQIQDGTIKKAVIILVNSARTAKVDWDTHQNVINTIKVLLAVSGTPIGNFSTLETALLRAHIEDIQERQRLAVRLGEIVDREKLKEKAPELFATDTDFHFIEVAFDAIDNPDELEQLNDIPTAFKIKKAQVDCLLHAAHEILDKDPEFNKLLEALR